MTDHPRIDNTEQVAPEGPRPLRLLFVCVGNSCRSQMAEGLARAMGGDRVEARSAGVSPGDKVAPKAVEVMQELGIDISSHRPKALTEEMLEWADRSFTMGCDARDMCPAAWLANAGDWRLDDPMGLGLEKYRAVRDEVIVHLRELFDAEGIPVSEEFLARLRT
jgi:arsenate reductase